MPMQRGSAKHGPNLDEQMQREVQGRIQGPESPRGEDRHEPEPAGEDQPEPDRLPDGHTEPSAPVGMTSEDVAGRSRLATYLPYRVFPADRARLLAAASEQEAPADVIEELGRLPATETYDSVTDVWVALGHGREDDSHRACART